MYRKKVVKAFKPRLKNVLVPRLNLAALRPEVEPGGTTPHSGGGTSCSTGISTSCYSQSLSRSDAGEVSSPQAKRGEYQVNHENFREFADEAAQKQKEAAEWEKVHNSQVLSKELREHAGKVALELPATKSAPKPDADFNYPHIFRKEFYEHADQVTQSPGSSAQHRHREQLRAHDGGFTVVTEQEEDCPPVSPLKICQVHNSPARQEAGLSSSLSQYIRSSPKPRPVPDGNDEKADKSQGKLKFPCFGLGFSSWPSSPKTAAAAAEKRAAPFHLQGSEARQGTPPELPSHAALEKRPAAVSPKITIVSPGPPGPTNKHQGGDGAHHFHEPLRHRSYFNPLERDHHEQDQLPTGFARDAVLQAHREATNVRFNASASASGSSSGTSIGDVHHECICSNGSSTPPSSDYKPHGSQDYDPYARMWDREVPQASPGNPELPVFETHLPCSIVGRCNKEHYNRYYLEGRKKDGSKPCQMGFACCKEAVTASELDEQMRTLFYTTSEQLPATSSEWPTVARARGSQFSTFLGDPRQDKHYVASGRFDVLPVPAYLGSSVPPLRVKGEAADKMRCRTCGVGVCKECSRVQVRWPPATESAIAAQFVDKILKTETEQFNPRAALKNLAKWRGITVDKLVDSRRACGSSASSGRCRPRFHKLCVIEDPCYSRVVPRKVGKQVDEKWLALKRRRPSLNDLWVLRDRCPQVCAAAPISSRPPPAPPVPWDTAKEQALIWDQRISSCRAALSTMAVYDSYRV